ncbi:MAG TPA: methyltransferase domain-containing protein [Zeimonas sp.]|nr:methyltransferase domain-containing protein [Zeimonas sp.]
MPKSGSRRDFLEASAALAFVARAGLAAAAGSLAAGAARADDEDFVPRSGQYGKDVIWIPTPDPLVTRMLQLAQVRPGDSVVDLGSGDGKIVIAAARDFGARARGIEYDEKMVALSRRNANAAGVADRATFEQADLFQSDFSSADVVTMYLMPHLNLRLRHRLLTMRPGTRVVSHEFRMGDWEPEESSRIGARSMHLWVVPANAGGDWRLRLAHSRGPVETTMTIRQRFQKLDGRVSFADVETTMRNAHVLGDQVHFSFTDAEGALRTVDARIEPTRMIGAVSTSGGEVEPFLAERVGDTPPIEGSSPMTPDEIRSDS